MGRLSGNQALATAVVERLLAAGVRTFCVCPGGRNAPLVEVLDALSPSSAELLGFFDERSAGFFAVGRARRDRRPVAVVTTSGTAAAELLPAMVEAYYSAVPLVAVTADRPRAYRGTGAPQTIEQPGLFGVYAPTAFDLEAPCEPPALPALFAPAHINVCFPEPLLAGWDVDVAQASVPAPDVAQASVPATDVAQASVPASDVAQASVLASDVAQASVPAAARPLVLVGGLQDQDDRREVLEFCRALGAPVLAEASSGIRASLGSLLLRGGDASVQRGFETASFDGVIRLGDVPSFRVWRDLDLALTQPVISISRKPWPGLTRGAHVHVPQGQALVPAVLRQALLGARAALPHWDGLDALFERDASLSAATGHWLAAHPESEPALVRRLSESIPEGSFVYLGNSLPIREWNQFASLADRRFTIGENRGANGIDGQVASFLGWAGPGVENWCVLGDLTALYDLSAPWALRHLEGMRLRLVVINNSGGRIFKRMFRNPRFQNLHATGFEAWAAMWGAEYHAGLPTGPVGPVAVIELRPDEAQTDAFWAAMAEETRR